MTEWELLTLTRLQLYDIESGLEMGDAMDVGRTRARTGCRLRVCRCEGTERQALELEPRETEKVEMRFGSGVQHYY